MLGWRTGVTILRSLSPIGVETPANRRNVIYPGLQRLFSQGTSDSSKPPAYKPPSPPARQPRPNFDPPISPMVRPYASRNGSGRTPSGPPPKYDPALLEALGISGTPPEKIAHVLSEENLTLEQLKMLVDAGMHKVGERGYLSDSAPQPRSPQNASEWDESMVEQINPKRRFFPGQTYDPEDLSPNTKIDYNKQRSGMRKDCPLGGKKGPKIDFANVALLSRFLTDGGRIMGRRKTRVCAKKQRELTTAIKRARMMNLLPYMHKLPEFVRKDYVNPFLSDS